MLQTVLPRIFGHHAVMLGIGSDETLLEYSQYSQVMHSTTLTPLVEAPSSSVIQINVNEWPVQPRSVDLVLLHHALEFSENPHRVLREACRTIMPGGKLVMIGFNPLSLWGICRLLGMGGRVMRRARYFHHRRIEDWLTLLNFSRCHLHYGGYFYPLSACLKPMHQSWLQNHSMFGELLAGSFYILVAIKDRAGMTYHPSSWEASNEPLLGTSYARNSATRDAT
ncbi:MAG: methyltransferase domain-containing protein [Endozoicomonadaceae bacterium]|nr:methyltransferase domain-containing protein [Endozoicomonadaceae bacterium]